MPHANRTKTNNPDAMSVAGPNVPAMTRAIHPWRLLRSLTHVTLVWHDGGPMGTTTFATNTISLRRGMTQAQRRCTILHELIHVDRGPVTVGLVAREEQRVRRETARLLLPDIKVVGESLAWAQTLEEAADDLWVDVGVLTTRLRNLHPAERGYLVDRLAEQEDVPHVGHNGVQEDD